MPSLERGMPEVTDDKGSILPPAVEIPPEVELFGKYELGKLLGHGAFAKVYHARNMRTGQNVAIKAVSKKKVLKGGMTAHIKREVSIMRRMCHHHIVRLHEVLATKTKIYFVMEFAKGGELFAKVAKGRFSEDLSRRYFQQLISAIGYCHSHGVFHRDLKPENLLLDENWDLKITDFGLSAVRDQIRADGLLHTLCGTPAYVAPEILAKKGYDGAKIDVWSCGVILYVLNAGYLPFNDPNLMVMYRKIYKGEFRCPRWTSPELRHFISRLLDANPESRITVDEITNDPWFKKGYSKTNLYGDNSHFDELKCREEDHKCMNAFDIISLSSGFDLSGLLNQPDTKAGGERFLSAETPEHIVDRFDEVAKAEEGVSVTTKDDWGLRLKGHNGDSTIVVIVHRLTEKLVVVEIKWRETDVGPSLGGEIWGNKLRAQLKDLIYHQSQSERPVPGA